jgi:MOSC domain-containing protein YiiM
MSACRFYAQVLQEGELQAGDPIVILQEDPARVTIREITDIYLTKHPDRNDIDRVLSVAGLARSWREHFQKMVSL